MAKATQNAQAASAPVSSKDLVPFNANGQKPDGLPDGALSLLPGQDTGRHNKLGAKIISKSLVIATPSVKSLVDSGMSRDAATEKAHAIGKALKPAIMGRVQRAASDENYIVRRYSESPTNGSIAVSLTKIKSSDKIAAIAAEYGLSIEEVKARLSEKPTTIAV